MGSAKPYKTQRGSTRLGKIDLDDFMEDDLGLDKYHGFISARDRRVVGKHSLVRSKPRRGWEARASR